MKLFLFIFTTLLISQLTIAEEPYNVDFTKQTNIGDLLVKDYKPEDITATNLKLEIKDELATFTFKDKGSLKLVQKIKDKYGKVQKVPFIYDKLEQGSMITINKDGEIVKAELSELPKNLEFKKGKLEKRDKKASEVVSKKKDEKAEEKPEKAEETEEQKEEKKKEVEEKKASVVEAGKEMEKAAAKTMKHQTKMSKQPKRQRRMALQK